MRQKKALLVKHEVLLITGQVTMAKRKQILDLINEGPTKVILLAQIGCLSEGLNIPGCHYGVIMELQVNISLLH